MTSSSFPRLRLLLPILLGPILSAPAYSAPALISDSAVRAKPASINRAVHSRHDLNTSMHGGDSSPEEKEYVQIAEQMRAVDAAFVETMRKAGPTEKRNLRTQHLEVMRPHLQRMNELTRTLRKNRTHPSRSNESTGVDVEGVPQPSAEIAGKSLDELARLGVAVEVLHQRADNAEVGAAHAHQTDHKK